MPKTVLVFIVAFGYSLVCSLFTWSVAQGWSHVHFAIAADFVSPVVQMLAVLWITEAKTARGKITLCGVTGVGYALGTVVILWGVQ
jgi:hypothetical protein